MDNTDFLSIFIEEAEEQIQTLNEGFLALENQPDNQELIREIARSAHTLKGGSKMMGFNEINQVAHKMEDLLIGVRDGQFSLDSSAMDTLFEGLDAIGNLVNTIEDGNITNIDVADLCGRLEQKIEFLKDGRFLNSTTTENSQNTVESVNVTAAIEESDDSLPDEPIQDYCQEVRQTIEDLNDLLIELEIGAVSQITNDKCLEYFEILKFQIGLLESQPSINLTAVSEVVLRLETTWWLVNQGQIALEIDIFDLILQGLGIIESEITDVEQGRADRWVENGFCLILDQKMPQLANYIPAPELVEDSDENTILIEQKTAEQNEVEQIRPEPANTELVAQTESNLANQEEEQKSFQLANNEESVSVVTPQIAGTAKKSASERIRVEVSQLNTLDSIVGEMLINRISSESHSASFRNAVYNARLQERKLADLRSDLSQFKFHFDSLPTSSGNGTSIQKDLDEFINDFNDCGEMTLQVLEELSNLSTGYSDTLSGNNLIVERLQNIVKDMRLVPISTVFSFFPRAVRDMEKELKKEIDLIIEGEESRLDKTLVDQLKSPLLHLIRNAVDHGIESPDIRLEHDKSSQGQLVLAAKEQADKIIISVQDDGSGIDPDKLKETAIEKGIINRVEAEAMNNDEALYLVCEPGLSTKSVVTDTSGRGVGMDVVRKEIESEMKGELKIESTIHQGTTFTLSLPLTLSDSQMCLVEASGIYFAIPANSINTTKKVEAKDIMSVANKLAIVIQGEIIPMVYLSDVLGVNQVTGTSTNDEVAVVVIEHGPQSIAFAVDAFRGVRLMVVKNLGNHLKRVRNIAGTSIMGNGEVAFILHVPDLMASSKDGKRGFSRLSNPEGLPALVSAKKKILVVEDSMMTREMERSILESAGYEVDVAVDGVDGLDKLSQNPYDLVITDVEMPRMDGFEFVKTFKESEALRNIPAIIVTTLSSEEEKRKGYEVGAEKYIVKSEFDREILLSGVESLIGLI